MKKRRLFFFSLLLYAIGMSAESGLVPAMIVHGSNGVRQVVQLDATDVTDLVVLQNGQSLSVDIPEKIVSGIRAITFAMIDASDVPTAIKSAETTLVEGVEKILHDGQVLIRLRKHDGAIIDYDVRGNKIVTNK